MPGHIGTEIAANSRKVINHSDDDTLSATELQRARKRLATAGIDAAALPDAAIQAMVAEQARRFHDDAPMTAAAAATVSLDGVKADRWRILVGDDAQSLDKMVRADPEAAYEQGFYERMATEGGWRLNVVAGNRPG